MQVLDYGWACIEAFFLSVSECFVLSFLRPFPRISDRTRNRVDGHKALRGDYRERRVARDRARNRVGGHKALRGDYRERRVARGRARNRVGGHKALRGDYRERRVARGHARNRCSHRRAKAGADDPAVHATRPPM